MSRIFLVIFMLFSVPAAHALDECENNRSPREQANRDKVGIISGNVGGTYARFAQDMADALDKECSLRIVPMLGRGSVQNLADLMWLQGVDIAIVQSDVFQAFLQQEVRGVEDIREKINYILKLYNEEIHIIAPENINNIRDLAGKRVSVGGRGSGTAATARIVFEELGIRIEPVFLPDSIAIDAVQRGEVAAAFFVVGKPSSALMRFKDTDKLHLVSIDFEERLGNFGYLPAKFTADDYPNLLVDKQTVDTIAVGAILTLYNFDQDSPRRELTTRFAQRFLFNLEKMKAGADGAYHKKWSEVDPAAKVPGWVRFKPVDMLISAR